MGHGKMNGFTTGLCLLLVLASSACSIPMPKAGGGGLYDPGLPSGPGVSSAGVSGYEPSGYSYDTGSLPTSSVTLIEGGLLRAESGGAEIGLNLRNPSANPLWVSVHFGTPGGMGDCALFKQLDPATEHLFLCPQSSVQARVRYPIFIEIFDGPNESKPFETVETSFRFREEDVGALQERDKG